MPAVFCGLPAHKKPSPPWRPVLSLWKGLSRLFLFFSWERRPLACLFFTFAGWKPALPGEESPLPTTSLTTETGFELMRSVVVIGGEWMIKTLDGHDRETPL